MLIFERSSQVGRVIIIYGYGPELSGYLYKLASLGQQEWKWVRLHVSLSSRLVKVPFRVVISRVPRIARGNWSANGFQVTTCFIFASVPLATAFWTECLCPPQFICRSLNPPSNGFKRWDLWHVIRLWGGRSSLMGLLPFYAEAPESLICLCLYPCTTDSWLDSITDSMEQWGTERLACCSLWGQNS